MKHIAVLMGGVSSEASVSMRSGAAIAKALRELSGDAALRVSEVVLRGENLEGIPADTDVAFIALHGGYGENGGVQADLEARGIRYTGSDAASSRVGMDKIATKRILDAAEIPTPKWFVIKAGAIEGEECFGFPRVAKAPREGSSVGVGIALAAENWRAALECAQAADSSETLVEEFIAGREWTVGIVGGKALPVIEIRPKSGVYDFDAKYITGDTQYVFPEENALTRRAQEIALATFEALGLRGYARVDFRVAENDDLYVLEVNTAPGFTATSLLPKAAAKAGLSFSELCAKIVSLA